MDTIHIDSKNVQMVAHRGVSGLETENTAFRAAAEAGYGVELDIQLSRDGQVVVFHDDNTQRVAGDAMVVEETTYETLRSLRLKDTDGQRGRNDLRIPSLREYVRICKKYGKVGVLELKNRFTIDDIRRIVDHRGGGLSSGNHLHLLRRQQPHRPARHPARAAGAVAGELLQRRRAAHAEEVPPRSGHPLQGAHARDRPRPEGCGNHINCWTVDTAEEARDLIEWGVDQITSNILE